MSNKVNFEIRSKNLNDKKNVKRLLDEKFPNKLKHYFTQNNKDRSISCCFSIKKTEEPEKVIDFINNDTHWKLIIV